MYEIKYKNCIKCLNTKPIYHFSKSCKTKDKLRATCKYCRSIERKSFYNKNKEKELEYCKNYKGKYPEKRKETLRKSREKCKDNKILAYELKRKFIISLKNKPCLDCNKIFDAYAMDFDHRNPSEKSFEISTAYHIEENILNKEIAKCDLVCANCHRVREFNRRNKQISSYSKFIYHYKDKPCTDCKQTFLPCVMDFDHNGNEKLFDISKPKSTKKSFQPTIIAEINKCEIVCANCHRIRTFVKR